MNTLAMTDKLKEAGVSETQARAHVGVVQGAMGDLVTKSDMREAMAELKAALAWQSIGMMVALTAIFSIISKW